MTSTLSERWTESLVIVQDCLVRRLRNDKFLLPRICQPRLFLHIFTNCFLSLDTGYNTTEMQNHDTMRKRAIYVIRFTWRRILTAAAVASLQRLRSAGLDQASASVKEETMS